LKVQPKYLCVGFFNSARGIGKVLRVVESYINRHLGVSFIEGTLFMFKLLHKTFCEQFHINNLFFAHEIKGKVYMKQGVYFKNLLRCCFMQVTECKILVVSKIYCKTL